MMDQLFTYFFTATLNNQFQFLPRVSAIDLHKPQQDFRSVFAWIDQFLPSVPQTMRMSVVAQKIRVEFSEGFSNYPLYIYEKTKIFFNGMDYYLFSSTDFGPNPDSFRTAKEFSVPTHRFLPFALQSILVCQMSIAAWGCLFAKTDDLTSFSMLLVMTITLATLGLGDTQPRFSLLIAPSLATISAQLIFSHNQASALTWPPAPLNLRWVGGGLLFMLSIYGLDTLCAATVRKKLDKPLLTETQEAKQFIDGHICNWCCGINSTWQAARKKEKTQEAFRWSFFARILPQCLYSSTSGTWTLNN